MEKAICTIFLVLSETDVKFGGPPGQKECVLPLEKSISTILFVLSETDVKFGGPPGQKRVRCPCRIDLGLLGGDKCYCEAL